MTCNFIEKFSGDKNIIDKILLYCDGDEKISKLVINLMSGMLGQSEKEGTKVKINSDIKQIFNFLDKYYQLEEGIMINQIENTDYFYGEVWVKNVGNVAHYCGSIDYGYNYNNLGGNPGSYGYWIMGL